MIELHDFKGLNQDFLVKLADLHKENLNYSINARMGNDYLVKMYSELQKSEDFFGLVAVESGSVVGCVAGTNHRSQINKTLKVQKYQIILKLLNPIFLIQNLKNLIDYLDINYALRGHKNKQNYILLWFVHEENLGSGLALHLIQKIQLELEADNDSEIMVDVRNDSFRAITGYSKLGYVIEKRLIFSNLMKKPQTGK
jgi:hypothetical protein